MNYVIDNNNSEPTAQVQQGLLCRVEVSLHR